MTYLLDVNVLIALLDPRHVHHEFAHTWFGREGAESWATCPMTENAILRILGNPKYPNSPGNPAVVASLLRQLREAAGHVFWPDKISLLDPAFTALDRVLVSKQVTDTYLLSLAAASGGRLATFDRRMAADATIDGRSVLCFLS